MAAKVKIDGKEYDMDSLSETARNQLKNLRVADRRIAQMEQDLALMRTARAAFASVLGRELKEKGA